MCSRTSPKGQTSTKSFTTGSVWTGVTVRATTPFKRITREWSSNGGRPSRRPEMRVTRRFRSAVCLALVPVAALLAFSSTPTDAQSIRYGISPGEIELVPPPGGTASAVLVVYNKAPNTARMRVAVRDLYVRPDGVAAGLEPGKLSWSVARFTRVQPAEFDLEPERQMPVRIAVTVPPEARGGLYGMIVVTSTPVL